MRGRGHKEAASGGWGGMPAAAIGVEHIDAHDKGATPNKKVMAHVWARTFFLFTPGFRLDAPKRNCNGNADASKGSEATQAFGNHSEVYNLSLIHI